MSQIVQARKASQKQLWHWSRKSLPYAALLAKWSPNTTMVQTTAIMEQPLFSKIVPRMNYLTEGAEKPPKIYKHWGIEQIPAAPSLKDNDDGDNNHTATRHIPIATATSDRRIVWQELLNSPHKKYTTGVVQQQLRDGYAPLSIAASVVNRYAHIITDDNGTKTPTKITNNNNNNSHPWN